MEYLIKIGVWIQKYTFSKQHGKIGALIVSLMMILILLYGSEGNLRDIDKLINGFSLSFGFAIIIYAVLYALAYETMLAIVAISAYSAVYFLESSSNIQDIINALGGLATLAIFIKWARKIRNPAKTVHPEKNQN